MASLAGYPQTMTHPQHRAAVVASFDSSEALPGAPEKFPPVEVHSPDQEEMLRARGYLRYGETMPKLAEYNEFPKVMSHPDHVDAAPDTQDARMEDGHLVRFTIRGTAEKYPAVTVHDADEQEAWEAKGYEAAGHSDELAFEKATLAPGKPGDEWPKWQNGVLVQDPDAPVDLSSEYPKWLHFDDGRSVLVNDPAHEARELQSRGSTKNEPVQADPPPANKPYIPMVATPAPAADADYAEFMAWKAGRDNPTPPAVETKPDADADERKTLIELAEESGIWIDKRWKLDRLREAVMGEPSPAE